MPTDWTKRTMSPSRFFIGLLTALPFLCAPIVLVAAEPAEHAEGKVDLFGHAIDLGIWTVVVFLVLLFVLRKYAWGPMLQGLHRREHSIQHAIDETNRARGDAERLQNQYRREMEQAQEKVRVILDQARRDGQQLVEELLVKSRAEIQSERERLRREIETAKDQVLQELFNSAADLATAVAAKALRRQLTPDDQRRLVDEALHELSAAGNHGLGQTAAAGS